jgi:cell wall-associated NlpC family hydrolase
MRLKRELHVGIVIGPGKFLHAPSSGGHVRVDQLDARPYREGFITARRIQP